MKIIKLISSVLLAATLITTVGCSTKNSSTVQSGKETVIISSDYKKYSTAEELTKGAKLIVKGTILSSKVVELNDLIISDSENEKLNPGGDAPASMNVYTVYTVKIKDTYKGSSNTGDIIEVKVRGGSFNGIDYIYKDGITFETNKNYVMFLSTFPNSPTCLLNPIQASYSEEKDAEGNLKTVHGKNDLKISEKHLDQIKKEK